MENATDLVRGGWTWSTDRRDTYSTDRPSAYNRLIDFYSVYEQSSVPLDCRKCIAKPSKAKLY